MRSPSTWAVRTHHQREPAMTRVAFAFGCHRPDPHTSVLAVEGDLDFDAAPQLKAALGREVATGHERLVVDLSGVTFMDSTALGVLVGVNLTLRPHGVAIVGASPAVLKLFQMTGLDRAFELFETVDLALSALAQRPVQHAKRTDEDAEDETKDAPTAGRAIAEDFGPGWGVGEGVRAQLTGDAAVALGIAATAMPFAASAQEQAERWLRTLRRYGDAGIFLTSLGFTDEPVDVDFERVSRAAHPSADPAPAATVIDHALGHAKRRGAAKVHTSDLLAAAMDVYGDAFERALARHGIRRSDLVAALDLRDGRSSGDAS